MADFLRVYFSFRSPYSRLGLHKIAALRDKTDLSLEIYPLIGLAEGVPFLDPTSSPPKMAYYAEDAYRMTKRMGLQMRLPKPFEVDFLPANKLFMLTKEHGKGLEWAIAVSDLRWGRGKDVSKPEVLELAAKAIGLPDNFVQTGLGIADTKVALKEAKALSDDDLIFGVPFAVLSQNDQVQKFWGQDRFDLLAEILETT